MAYWSNIVRRCIQPEWQFTEAGLDQDLKLLKDDAMLLMGEFSLSMKPPSLDHSKLSRMGQRILPKHLVGKMNHRITVHVNGGQSYELDLGPRQRSELLEAYSKMLIRDAELAVPTK